MATISSKPAGNLFPLSEPVIFEVRSRLSTAVQMSVQITFLDTGEVEELFTDRIITPATDIQPPVFEFDLSGALQDRVRGNKDFYTPGELETVELENLVNFNLFFSEYVIDENGELEKKIFTDEGTLIAEATQSAGLPHNYQNYNGRFRLSILADDDDPQNIIRVLNEGGNVETVVKPPEVNQYYIRLFGRIGFYKWKIIEGGDDQIRSGNIDVNLVIFQDSNPNKVVARIPLGSIPLNASYPTEFRRYTFINQATSLRLDPRDADGVPRNYRFSFEIQPENGYRYAMDQDQMNLKVLDSPERIYRGIDAYFKPDNFEDTTLLNYGGLETRLPRKFLTNMPRTVQACRGSVICVPIMLDGEKNKLAIKGFNGNNQAFEEEVVLQDVITEETPLGDNAFRTICVGGDYDILEPFKNYEFEDVNDDQDWQTQNTNLSVVPANDPQRLRGEHTAEDNEYSIVLPQINGLPRALRCAYQMEIFPNEAPRDTVNGVLQDARYIYELGLRDQNGDLISQQFIDGTIPRKWGARFGNGYQAAWSDPIMGIDHEPGRVYQIDIQLQINELNNGFIDGDGLQNNVLFMMNEENPNDSTLLHDVRLGTLSNPDGSNATPVLVIETQDSGVDYLQHIFKPALGLLQEGINTISITAEINDFASGDIDTVMIINGVTYNEPLGNLDKVTNTDAFNFAHFPPIRRICWNVYFPGNITIRSLFYGQGANTRLFEFNEGQGGSFTSEPGAYPELTVNFNPNNGNNWQDLGTVLLDSFVDFEPLPPTLTTPIFYIKAVTFGAIEEIEFLRFFNRAISSNYDCLTIQVLNETLQTILFEQNFNDGNISQWLPGGTQNAAVNGALQIDFDNFIDSTQRQVGDLIAASGSTERILTFNWQLLDLTGVNGTGSLIGRTRYPEDYNSNFNNLFNFIFISIGQEQEDIDNTGEILNSGGFVFTPAVERRVVFEWNIKAQIVPYSHNPTLPAQMLIELIETNGGASNVVASETPVFQNGNNDYTFSQAYDVLIGRQYSYRLRLTNPQLNGNGDPGSDTRGIVMKTNTVKRVLEGTTGYTQRDLRALFELVYPSFVSEQTIILGNAIDGRAEGFAAIPFDISEDPGTPGANTDFSLRFKAFNELPTRLTVDNIQIKEAGTVASQVSEKFTVKFVDCCPEDIKINFRNAFGFFDSITVKKVQQDLKVESAGFLKIQSGNFDRQKRGNGRLRSAGLKSFKVSTQELRAQDMDWLEELLVTQDAYIDKGGGVDLPVTIKDGTFRQSEQDNGLIVLEFTVEYSNELLTQRG